MTNKEKLTRKIIEALYGEEYYAQLKRTYSLSGMGENYHVSMSELIRVLQGNHNDVVLVSTGFQSATWKLQGFNGDELREVNIELFKEKGQLYSLGEQEEETIDNLLKLFE